MYFLLGIIVTISCISLVSYLTFPADSTIPPTPAFSKISINDTIHNATKYNDIFYVASKNNTILVSMNFSKISIDLNQPTIYNMGGVLSITCNANSVLHGINTTGHPICKNLPSPITGHLGGVHSSACSGNQTMFGITTRGNIMCR